MVGQIACISESLSENDVHSEQIWHNMDRWVFYKYTNYIHQNL